MKASVSRVPRSERNCGLYSMRSGRSTPGRRGRFGSVWNPWPRAASRLSRRSSAELITPFTGGWSSGSSAASHARQTEQRRPMPRRAEGAGAGEAVADLGSWEDEAGRAVAAATAPSAGGSPVSESSEEGEAAEYPDAWDAENVEEESVWASDDADEPGSSSYPADLSESLSSLTRTRAMSWRTSSGKEGGLWWRLDECEG
eukprot:scaffold51627_cov26-Tisochrysis_lutea.AAC.3